MVEESENFENDKSDQPERKGQGKSFIGFKKPKIGKFSKQKALKKGAPLKKKLNLLDEIYSEQKLNTSTVDQT